ncbi:uncharacterized protein METZ01_LOCUS481141, partial [marine metagenome]
MLIKNIRYIYIILPFTILFGASPVITSNGGGDAASISFAENNTAAITTVTSTDSDTGDTATYSISGGADAADFAINGSSGVLTFASTPNYESPADDGTNNEYIITVQVSDGSNTDSQTITITVTDINEFAPEITSNSGGSTASISFAENNT